MEPKLIEFLKDIAEHVPFLIDIVPFLDGISGVQLRLTCNNGLQLSMFYDINALAHTPQDILREDIIYRIERAFSTRLAEQWRAMKAMPQQGIALITFGPFSLQKSIEWPPTPELHLAFSLRHASTRDWPVNAPALPNPIRAEHARLRESNDMTRVARYEVISQ